MRISKGYKTKYDNRILAKGVEVTTDPFLTNLNNNVLVIGGSGSGKTGGYVIPNLQTAKGSICVCDTKNMLEKSYRDVFEIRDYKIMTLDLVNPEQSWGYNPLDYIRRYPDGHIREQDVLSVARALCPTLDPNEPIWDSAARSYVAFLIAYCMEALEPAEQNLITVSALHRKFSQNNGDATFLPWLNAHRDSFATKKYFEINANRGAEKMFASIMGFVSEALSPFVYKEAEYIFTNKPNMIDLHLPGKERVVIFVNSSDTDRIFDKAIDLFFTQMIQVLCRDADNTPNGKLNMPVHIMLDDFACSGRIPDFDKIISVIRSRDISVSLILQSMSQLESVYDEKVARTILNNCDRWVYLGGQDMETVRTIAERANRTPEAILCMPRNMEYLITNGEKAAMIEKIKPYSTVPASINTTMAEPLCDEDLPFA